MPSPTPAPTPVPTPAPLPEGIDLTSSQPKQGGFLFVRFAGQAGVSAPVAYFATVGYTMQPQGGVWYAFIGLSTDISIANHPLEVWEGDTLLASSTVPVVDGDFTRVEFDLPPAAVDLLVDQERINRERELVASTVSAFTPAKYWFGPWITPAEGDISSEFGEMRSENGGPYFPHLGTDIANEAGTPIYAPADGVVALNEELLLYGNVVILDHGVGVFSLYAHMDSSVVVAGQPVSKGQLIGYMGQTGYVTGPHVHWEAIVHGTRVNGGLFTLGATDP
ncbi:MAG: M23 family metallopeptidase [Chloroflexota bacterium]